MQRVGLLCARPNKLFLLNPSLRQPNFSPFSLQGFLAPQCRHLHTSLRSNHPKTLLLPSIQRTNPSSFTHRFYSQKPPVIQSELVSRPEEDEEYYEDGEYYEEGEGEWEGEGEYEEGLDEFDFEDDEEYEAYDEEKEQQKLKEELNRVRGMTPEQREAEEEKAYREFDESLRPLLDDPDFNPNEADNDGSTILHYSALVNHAELAEELIKRGFL